MKKLISIITIMAIMLSSMPVFASSQPDAWAQAAVSQGKTEGWFPASLDGQYQRPITRVEFAELFVRMLIFNFNKGNASIEAMYKTTWPVQNIDVEYFLKQVENDVNFTDTDSQYAVAAKVMGITDGATATTFNPSANITRQEAAKMFMSYMHPRTMSFPINQKKIKDLSSADSWAQQAILHAVDACMMTGKKKVSVHKRNADGWEYDELSYTLFEPKGMITVQEAAQVMKNILGNSCGASEIGIRSILPVSMDMINEGLRISGNMIYLRNTAYTNPVSQARTIPYQYDETRKYYNLIDFKQAIVRSFVAYPEGTIVQSMEDMLIRKNVKTESDVAIYETFPNESGVLAKVTVKPFTRYLCGWGGFGNEDSSITPNTVRYVK